LGREVSAAFYENIGTIPDERAVAVINKKNNLGKVEESFAASLSVGDVFLLGGKSVRVTEVRDAVISVEPHAARPTVPTWSSHMKGAPLELSREVGLLRRGVVERFGKGRAAVNWLRERYDLQEREAIMAAEYIAQQAALSRVPDDQQPVIELYEIDGRQTAVYHTCLGRRINEVLARMVGARVFMRTRNNTTLTTDDGGFLLTLSGKAKLSDQVWKRMLDPERFDEDLLAGLRASNLLKRTFRYVANTGLLILRRAGGRTLKRGGASWNNVAVFDRLCAAEPNFPLIVETLRVVRHDLLDVDNARAYLEQRIDPIVTHPKVATPFTFGILTSSFADAVTMEDRVSMVEALYERALEVVGA
jgi:ATP-dependent Lhr-like helicase